MKGKPAKDITGQRFNRLIVLGREGNTAAGNAPWLCGCDCGNLTRVTGSALKNNYTKSCGCLMPERQRIVNTTHGMTKKRIYKLWIAMKARCLNPNNKDFEYYSKKGICERWHRFENFYEDMGQAYEEHVKIHGPNNTTIDRKDNDKGYSLDNCRWVTKDIQAVNKKKTAFYELDGERLTTKQISNRFNISNQNLQIYLKRGYSLLQAIERAKKAFHGANQYTLPR